MTASARPARPDGTYWRLRPRAPAPGTRLTQLDDLPEGTAREFTFGQGKSAFSMIAVRRHGAVHGYLNICPHYSSPLNAREGGFLNADGSRLVCTMHFAEFRVEDGFGVAGAAENCWLEPIALTIRDGTIEIA